MGILAPNRCVASVDRLSVDELRAAGIRCVLVDRDNTCVPRGGEIPDEVVAWIENLRSSGIYVVMVSNNFHGREVEDSAARLGCMAVHHAMKPLPHAVRRAMRLVGVGPSETIMVGDQVFTDVVAGNLAGVTSVLVRPQSTRDLWYTHILHLLERPILHGRVYEGEEDPSLSS